MSRRPDLRVAGFADVQLVTLAFQDEQRTREFVARTLGKLADADRGRRHAVRVHRRAVQRCRARYTNRSTVLNHLRRRTAVSLSNWPATASKPASRPRSPSGL